jgi:hypothetical protein
MPGRHQVIKMPVEQLLGEDGQPLALTRSDDLSGDDIRAPLRGGGVRFVLANVGYPLAWVEGPQDEGTVVLLEMNH